MRCLYLLLVECLREITCDGSHNSEIIQKLPALLEIFGEASKFYFNKLIWGFRRKVSISVFLGHFNVYRFKCSEARRKPNLKTFTLLWEIIRLMCLRIQITWKAQRQWTGEEEKWEQQSSGRERKQKNNAIYYLLC